jgi:ureidoglycolate hydrolase
MKMKSLTVKAKKLTASSFAKFGKVADAHTVPPLVETENLKFWTTIATYTVDGETEIALCHVKKSVDFVGLLERHVKTPEILVPIKGDFLLPVAPAGNLEDITEIPEASGVEAFLVRSNQAVVMEKGVWHTAPIPIGKETSFFVIFKKETTKQDAVFKKLRNDETVIVVR